MRIGKGKFTGDLTLRKIRRSKDWVLIDPLTYVDSYEHSFTIPAGFKTDLASVPRLCQWLYPKSDDYDAEACLHDYMYSRVYNRYLCDWVFLDAMISEGVKPWKYIGLFLGVRLGGYFAWRRNKRS